MSVLFLYITCYCVACRLCLVYHILSDLLVGNEYMEAFDMMPRRSGYSDSYDPTFDPRITNEFATAAFRFGHSLIYTDIPQRSSDFRKRPGVDLKTVFDSPRLFVFFKYRLVFMDSSVLVLVN